MSEKIVDRCPSCGARSLFIGEGGYLTCSVIGCKEPGTGHAVEAMQERIATLERERDEVVQQAALLADMVKACEARLAVAVEALREIGARSSNSPWASMRAHEALAKIEEGTT